MKRIILLAIVGLWAVQFAQAATFEERMRYDQNAADKYRANELDLDLFGTYATHDRFGNETDRGGGGLGLNYFPNKYVGIGADSYLEEWRWPYRVNGSLIVRFPLGQSGLAIYGLGGGGREWKYVPQWTGHAGGGLEFRFNPYTGIFADARRVFPENTPDYTLARAGLRVSF